MRCYEVFDVMQMKVLGDNISEGDVLLSNHPCAGGSHLPDLTVITPVGTTRSLLFALFHKFCHCTDCHELCITRTYIQHFLNIISPCIFVFDFILWIKNGVSGIISF